MIETSGLFKDQFDHTTCIAKDDPYLKHFEEIDITNAIEQVNNCICLPSSVGLNEEDIKYISGVINE